MVSVSWPADWPGDAYQEKLSGRIWLIPIVIPVLYCLALALIHLVASMHGHLTVTNAYGDVLQFYTPPISIMSSNLPEYRIYLYSSLAFFIFTTLYTIRIANYLRRLNDSFRLLLKTRILLLPRLSPPHSEE